MFVSCPQGSANASHPVRRARFKTPFGLLLSGRPSLRFEFKDPSRILAQELRPDVITERHMGHVAEDTLER